MDDLCGDQVLLLVNVQTHFIPAAFMIHDDVWVVSFLTLTA